MRSQQKGFAVVELVLILVLVGIIGFVAWRVIVATGDAQTAQNAVPTSEAIVNDATKSPAKNSSDLGKLQDQLNSTSLDDDSSTAQLDQQTTF